MTAIKRLPPGRIVVVDDEPDIREYIKMLLQEHHYEVVAVASAEEALSHLESEDSDVLITDIRMPGMSGIELIQKARRLREFLQCIVITGHGDMDSAVMSLRIGAAGYLQKPLDFAELEASVALVLEKSRLVRQLKDYQQHLERLVEERTQELLEANQQLLCEIEIRKEAELKANNQASHDYLTGLPNRLLLEDRLLVMLASARRHKTKFSVMILDLDGFKEINDTQGHEMGDRVLQTVAKRLTEILRESDTVVRMGGDEFLLLLPDIGNSQYATKVAEKMQAAIAAPVCVGQNVANISASVGWAIYPEDGGSTKTLIQKADLEMYRMKQVKSVAADQYP